MPIHILFQTIHAIFLTDWITDSAWDNVTELDKLPGFHGVVDSFETSNKEWHEWYTETEPENTPLVGKQNLLLQFE